MIVALIGAIVFAWTDLSATRAVAAWSVGAVAFEMPSLLLLLSPFGLVVVAVRRLRVTQARKTKAAADLAALCDLTTIGLTGGLGIQPALEIASGHIGPALADDIGRVLRQARVAGIAAAMLGAGGSGQRLYRVIGQAAATGAPLLSSVARLADDLHAEQATIRLQEVRRLPVALLFPLTLLILPGFLLLTIAPVIVDSLARLAI